jgi:hypothetical protein
MSNQSRVKVTLQIPTPILAAFDAAAKSQLGIGRNAFFTIAAVLLLVKMTAILSPKKRITLLLELEEEFDRVLVKARKTA